MRLAGILALTLVHGEAEDNATCVDLLTLPREDSSSQCYRGDCSCHLAVEEVVWQVLRPLEDGSAGLEYHSRTLTPTLGAWMDQAAAFLEGGEPLDAGFRATWLELAFHPSALCQRAQTLLAQLWSVLAALAACFAAEAPDAGAGQSALCLEKLRITQALTHDHGGVWSRPFWLPLGNPLKDAAEFAVASRASSATRWQRVSPELMRNAYLDFNAIITALFKEVWTDEQTWLQQMEESYSAPASDGCDFTFYAVASLERLQAAAEYLASHQWSCFLTESVDDMLGEKRLEPDLDCVILQHGAALRFCLRKPSSEKLMPKPGSALQVLSAGQRSLARFVARRAESARGNSLCFSQRRKQQGFSYERCCEDGRLMECFDEAVLTNMSCCRAHKHQCSELRLHVAEWSVPRYHQELDVKVAYDGLHCLGDDLYRDYLEDVRQHLESKTLQAGILGTRVEKLVANQAPKLLGSCPEVSLLGRIVVVERLCQSLLQNPLSPEAVERQEVLHQDVEDILPNLEANKLIGYLTRLPEELVAQLMSGACGKMIQAEREAEESQSGVLQPDYQWPAPLGGQSLERLGCWEGAPLKVGQEQPNATGWDPDPIIFADLDHPMPHDGRLTDVQFPFMAAEGQDIHLDVILLRPQPSSSSYLRRGTLTFKGQPVREELFVWRGDVLAFAGTGARMVYRNCSRCRTALLPMGQSSHFREVQKQGAMELGATMQRAYSWSAQLIPRRCPSSSWHSPALPPRLFAPKPASSSAHCAGGAGGGAGGAAFGWQERSCRFRDLCYDTQTGDFEFYGQASEDLTVGLSMFSDVRMTWSPKQMEPEVSNTEVSWVHVPAYLAMRHAAHNWGHHFVETTLALYALILSNEDIHEIHGRRLIFFLDECSWELQGDAIEFCMRFVARPLNCIREIPHLCAKFTQQLWPLLSDWAPLEPGHFPQRLPDVRTLCFRSLAAGLAPWRRPVQTQDAAGKLAQQEWAPDFLLAPVIRQFRVAALQRLEVPRQAPSLLLAAVKKGRRSVRNREELLEWLAIFARSKGLGFRELDFRLPLRDQAQLLASARVMAASMGATLLAGLLLPADSGVLALPACHKVGPGRSVTCETEQLMMSCGLRWAQYPVSFDDVFYTIGRGFDFTARQEVLDPLLEQLLGRSSA